MIRFVIVAVLLAGLSQADAAGTRIQQDGRVAIGVAPFEAQGYGASGVATAAQGIAEAGLSRQAGVRLVERRHLTSLLEEISFQQSGATSRVGSVVPGQTANVQVLLFGQVSRQADRTFRLSLRAVDVATSDVLHTGDSALPQERIDDVVRQLTRRTVTFALAKLPVSDVLIPAGSVRLGSTRYPEEGPEHVVHLDAFRIDRFEVTQGAYAAWLDGQGRKTTVPDQPNLPAVGVNWNDASAFCASRNKRLPTEAEWERAARGPDGNDYPWGAAAPAGSLARFSEAGPTSIDGLPAGTSSEGIHQLAGNVAEWVNDWYDAGYYARSPADNPRGPDIGDYRVVRGGGFSSVADELRAAARSFHNPLRGAGHIGFRCARTEPTAP